jgi:hypothetical protein
MGYFWIAMRIVAKNTNDAERLSNRKKVSELSKVSLRLINIVEKKFKISPTVMYPAEMRKLNGSQADECAVVMFRLSKQWIKVQCIFSFCLLMLRSSLIPCMDKVKTFESIFKTSDLIWGKCRNKDANYLVKSKSVITALLGNYAKVLKGRTTKQLWQANLNTSGIMSLANMMNMIKGCATAEEVYDYNVFNFTDKKLLADMWKVMNNGKVKKT